MGRALECKRGGESGKDGKRLNEVEIWEGALHDPARDRTGGARDGEIVKGLE